MSDSIKIRAKYSRWVLLQYTEDLFDVCPIKELPKQLLGVPLDALGNFSPDDAATYVKNHGLKDIKLLGYIAFDRFVVIIFRHETTRHVSSLMQSRFNPSDIASFIEDEKNDMHVMVENWKSKTEAGSGPRLGSESVSDRSQSMQHGQNGWGSIDSNTVIESRESPDPDYPKLSDRPNTHFESRERSETPNAYYRSGVTPEPRPGGTLIYARRVDGGIRGIIERNEVHEIELVKNCQSDLLSTNILTTSFGPGGDSDFLDRHTRSHKLKRSEVEIVGCAGKWNSSEKKIPYIYIIFKLKTSELQNEAKYYRTKGGEKYQGPMICSWSAFKASVCFEKEDLVLLNGRLGASQFAQEALAEQGVPVQLKKSTKRPDTKKTSDIAIIQTDMDKMKGAIVLIMEKLNITPRL